MQAVKDVDAQAFRHALPRQLALCEELLEDLSALPGGDAFREQWVRSCQRHESDPFSKQNFGIGIGRGGGGGWACYLFCEKSACDSHAEIARSVSFPLPGELLLRGGGVQ